MEIFEQRNILWNTNFLIEQNEGGSLGDEFCQYDFVLPSLHQLPEMFTSILEFQYDCVEMAVQIEFTSFCWDITNIVGLQKHSMYSSSH